MTESKEHYISFRVDSGYFEKVNRLSDKLGLGRSQTIRMMLDRGIEEFLDEKSSLSLVSNKQWNDVVGARLERFLEMITQVTKDIKAVPGQAKKTESVQAIDRVDLEKWIDECIENDATFETKDASSQVEKVKTTILTVIKKLRGRVD